MGRKDEATGVTIVGGQPDRGSKGLRDDLPVGIEQILITAAVDAQKGPAVARESSRLVRRTRRKR